MVFIVIGLTAALAAASVAEAVWPVLEIVNVFAPWWSFASIIVLGLTALRTVGRLRAASIALAIVIGLRIFVLLGPMAGASGATSQREPDLRVISLNMWKDNAEPALVARWLGEQDADIVILLEAPIGSDVFDDALRKHYPYQYSCTRNGRCSTRVLSKWPALAVRHLADGDPENRGGLSALTARIDVSGAPVTIAAVHTDRPWPLGRRDRRLDQIESILRDAKSPVVLAGDFNSAPWTVSQSRIASAAGLGTATGTLATWPTWSSIGLLPLDQAYVSSCIGTVRAERGPEVGSDHYPLVMAFDRRDCALH